MKEINVNPDSERGNPEKAYREELQNKGSVFTDTPSEAEARDKAKVEKALSGQSQKIDTVSPDELQDDNNEEFLRESEEKK